MMFWDVLAVFLMAFFLSALVVGLFGWRRPADPSAWTAAAFLFLLLFPVLWAAHLWTVPAGPVIWGVAWLPIVVAGLILVLLVAAAAGRDRRPTIAVGERAPGETAAAQEAFGLFFWLAVLILFVVIVAGYVVGGPR